MKSCSQNVRSDALPRWSQLVCLEQDLNRYFYPTDESPEPGLLGKAKIFLTTQGCWATTVYRLRRYALVECRIPVVRGALGITGRVLNKAVEVATGICIPSDTDIGPGLYIGHFGGIFLNGGVVIGKYCNISQCNTLGLAGRGEKSGVPEVGDFVYIGPGAKIIGRVKVGSHAAIGANAVVTRDVPEHGVAVGVPAKVISKAGSDGFVNFCRRKSLL
jgi:serine O-acetyltransferase